MEDFNLTKALIILNVIVFLIVFSMPEELMMQAFGMLSFSGTGILEPWRIVTSIFMHASASHLFFNMIALYFFGRVVEKELGPKKFASIYFLSGIAGSIAYGLTSAMPAVGASGCIFGVMGAAMFLKPKEWIRLYFIPLPLGVIAILYVITQVALSVIPIETTGVAYIAHIGGLLAGSAIAFYFEPKRSVKGLGMMILILFLMIILWPIIGLIVGIGQVILSIVDFVIGLVLYGIAKLLLSWVWVI